MGTHVAQLTSVGVRLGGVDVLREVTLDVVAGRQLAVLGPSGAGKSTLLRVLEGEIRPTSGTVEISAATAEHPRSVVFQQPLLFPWLTVEQNIAVGLRYAANAHADRGRVDELIGLLGLDGIRGRYPDEVSGGQAQRAALARGLAVDPRLVLLDEPFSALDPVTRDELQRWLRAETQRSALTTVTVTHDIDEALVLADDIVLLGHQGSIARQWAIEPASGHDTARLHPARAEIREAFEALGSKAGSRRELVDA